jgi:hypothetical protein
MTHNKDKTDVNSIKGDRCYEKRKLGIEQGIRLTQMPHQGIVGRKNWREFDVLIQIA